MFIYTCVYNNIYLLNLLYIYNNNIYLLNLIYILNTIQIADTNGPLKKS